MLNLINSKVTGFIDKSVWLTDIKSQVSSKLYGGFDYTCPHYLN